MWWSSTFRMTWVTLVMMVGPPGEPSTILSRPLGSTTMDGVIAESMRLPGWIALASPWTKPRSEEHTSELQSRLHLVCRLLLEKKKKKRRTGHLIEPREHPSS